jgi:hypothetical protein
MLKRLNDPLSRIQIGQLNKEGFVNLTKQICKDVLKVDDASFLNLIYKDWDAFESDLKAIIEKKTSRCQINISSRLNM